MGFHTYFNMTAMIVTVNITINSNAFEFRTTMTFQKSAVTKQRKELVER